MEQKFNNKDDGTKHKSINDFERRGQAEKSRAAEQQKRARVLNGSRLFRDVTIWPCCLIAAAKSEWVG